MSKKVVVIGAGVSGLSAGCYAAMNGYDVEVHESHALPGGLCTAWKRGAYTVDGCIHWLLGTKPGSEMYRIWEELGVVPAHAMLDHDIFARVVARDGRTLRWYADPGRLEAHLLSLAPGDRAPIGRLCAMIAKLGKMPMLVATAAELRGTAGNLWMLARLAPYLGQLAPMADTTLAALAESFQDPLLRGAVAYFLGDPAMPALALPFTLGPMGRGSAGYPLGGSAPIARTLERRLLELGGRVVYESKVAKVIERAGRAVGVRLTSGAEVDAERVIAACDLRFALQGLLDGSRVDPVHRELLERGRCYAPLALVSFGYDGALREERTCVGTYYELDTPIELAGRRTPWFTIKGSFDPSFAPAGKSVVSCGTPTDWDTWGALRDDPAAYDAAKRRLVQTCLEQVEARVPGFGARVEMTDVATPLTFQRYTGNHHGSFMTWILSGEMQRRTPYVPKTVPGLAAFYIASMWTNPPGGVTGGAVVGRTVTQLLCRDDGHRFTSSTPTSAQRRSA